MCGIDLELFDLLGRFAMCKLIYLNQLHLCRIHIT